MYVIPEQQYSAVILVPIPMSAPMVTLMIVSAAPPKLLVHVIDADEHRLGWRSALRSRVPTRYSCRAADTPAARTQDHRQGDLVRIR